MRQKTFLATTAMAALIGSGAMAVPVSIDQIGAIWQNPTGSAVGAATVNTDNGDGDPTVDGETVEIFWGTPATNNGQSGYSFAPTPVSFLADPDMAYSLGTFTHFNQPIFDSGGSLDSVELAFHFAGSPEGVPVTASFDAIFDFEHDETLNTATLAGCDPQVSTTPCDDVVTVSAQGGPDEIVDVGNTRYIFSLLGFSPDGTDGSFESVFFTEEGENSSRDLWFQYSVSVVPLPAAGWLLLAGIGGLAAVGRRRKKA